MSQKTIAWIEDDIDVIYAVVQPLQKAGFKILEYRNYSQAVDSIAEISKCNLILLDLILPPGDKDVSDKYLGLRFLKELRDKKIHLPVIILSVVANSREISAEEIKSLNAVSISKPVRPSILKSRVDELLT